MERDYKNHSRNQWIGVKNNKTNQWNKTVLWKNDQKTFAKLTKRKKVKWINKIRNRKGILKQT
jgi:hypothetical protein